MRRHWALAFITVALAACGSAPPKPSPPTGQAVHGQAREAHANRAPHCPDGSPYAPAQEDPRKRGNYTAGGLYAPGVRDSTPGTLLDVSCIPEPLVTDEPRSSLGNQSPYTVLGKRYRVLDSAEGYVERGTASYYGSKFHGRRTSNQEVYDMYAFTAAHKSLPLPSFARITNLDNGQSIVVRINDRGPFHDDRLIDLSYAAAVRLGIYPRGTGSVEVRTLTANDSGAAVASTSRSAGQSRVTAPRQRATAMDRLVGQLPDTAVNTASAQSVTGMDRLMERLPDSVAASAAAVKSDASPVSSAGRANEPGDSNYAGATTIVRERRYYIEPVAGQAPSADRFDAWMKEQGLSVATGRPAPVQRNAATVASARRSGAASGRYGDVSDQSTVLVSSSIAPVAAGSGDTRQWLQIASFASLDNARRAMEQLSSAGILDASLSDVESQGRTMWRLRVPSEKDGMEELVSRLVGLGFGRPQIVRE
jgi:rare lipoprotein A